LRWLIYRGDIHYAAGITHIQIDYHNEQNH